MKLELELPDPLLVELQQAAGAMHQTLPQAVTRAVTAWLRQSSGDRLPTPGTVLPAAQQALLRELLFDGGPCLVSADEMKRLAYE